MLSAATTGVLVFILVIAAILIMGITKDGKTVDESWREKVMACIALILILLLNTGGQ